MQLHAAYETSITVEGRTNDRGMECNLKLVESPQTVGALQGWIKNR